MTSYRSVSYASDKKKKDLRSHAKACKSVLNDLNQVLDKYHDVDSTGPTTFTKKFRRTWKRLKWEPDDVKELRGRLTSCIGLLNNFMGTLGL